MIDSRSYGLLVGLVVLVWLTRPAHAFGAGNVASISKVEGQNWRHGDIEDALLTLTMARALNGKKFNNLQVSRVYFGNWLRDYSQAIDVGTVKSVSAEAIRLLLSVLAFLTFGYGSGEFEVTASRLGCYRPEDHIDNPKNYADNEDARHYDRRLRGPVDESVELAFDPETGMKNYIANERAGITTSAKHVRNLFGKAIELGRKYARDGNKPDKYECFRLLGTGLHCLEDYFAHSNYTELALIELGERNVFPHVGRDTRMPLDGADDEVYPVVTGTFGGVDFLHSVTGEISDKLTQNEIDELEGTLRESAQSDTSILRNLLDMIPDGIFGGKHQSDKIDEIQSNAQASQLQNMQVSPREPEDYTSYVQQVFGQIMPAIEFHDDVMKNISQAMDVIPVLPKILAQLEEQLSRFVFANIAPFIVPVIHQVRNELRTGSNEIIESSKREQHIVFEDDRCTDPTHSMLSKDHFTNVLNEVAGRCAARMVHWVVPQLMEAMDDDGADVDRVLDRVLAGILAHPAQRDMGRDGAREGRRTIFAQVEGWWREMSEERRDDYRRKLSRRGIENGENHKDGVQDTGHGHGCVGKLKMRKTYGEPSGGLEDRIASAAADAIFGGATGALSGIVESNTGVKLTRPGSGRPEQRDEGIGGLLGAAGSLLGGSFKNEDAQSHSAARVGREGRYAGDPDEQHAYQVQAQRAETQYPDGGRRSDSRRHEQDDRGRGYQERSETRREYGGGYEQRTQVQETYGGGGGGEGYGGGGSYGGGYGGGEIYGGGDGSHGRRDDNQYGRRPDEGGYGGGHEERREEGYGRRRDDDDDGRRHRRRDDDGGDEGGHHRRRDDDDDGGDEGGHHHHHHRDDHDDDGGNQRHRRDDAGDGDDERRRQHHRRDDDDDSRRHHRERRDDDEGPGGSLGGLLGQVVKEAFR